MDRRKFLNLAQEQSKQQIIKRVAPDVPIQVKRGFIDSIDTMQQLQDNPTITRRGLLNKMAGKLKVRQNPINKEESIIRIARDAIENLRGRFSYMNNLNNF